MGIGNSMTRVDSHDKVTGQAKYAGDLCPKTALTAKILHSTIANGRVKSMDIHEALALPGVVKIVTCFDVPDIRFPTAGHPWSVEESHQDIADRKLLNQRVRVFGDDIAAVIAEDDVAADRALRAIKVEYEEYPALVTPDQALAPGASQMHGDRPGNLLNDTGYREPPDAPAFDEAIAGEDVRVFESVFHTQSVQHCHIEPPVSWAYTEGDRVVVVASTQIPHIVRRVVGQALGIPWGKVRIVKPYIGGGFGNKQDALYEPLNAYLATLVPGKTVKLEATREETFTSTRARHAIDFTMKTAVRPDGKFVARHVEAISNQGGYASHGHAIAANAINEFRHLYGGDKSLEARAKTVYTNIATGGAMRGYGIPQAISAMESHMDDIAAALGVDPFAFRKMNCMREGFVDPPTGIAASSYGLVDCMERGREMIGWDEKRRAYQNQTGPLRRGVGMSIFSYKTGVWPFSLETAAARIILNQDGSVQLQMGATEIGQGADTVFTQMAAETLGIREQNVHIISAQDTDITPFDTGAYASRQTYVSGSALKKAALSLKAKILDYAAEMLELPASELDIRDGEVTGLDGEVLLSLESVAMEAFYSLSHSVHLTAEETFHCKSNTFSFGCCFAEIEIDIPYGKINVLNLVQVHDSGTLINPQLAEAQVHGGMSMGLGYAIGEQMLYDKNARLLNGNLLDYKLPTALDTPELAVDFIETCDPTGPYGNKALGEPPAIPTAAAVRNAVLHATGVAVNSLPLEPQKLVKLFTEAGLTGGERHV